VEGQPLDPEPPIARLGEPELYVVQVPVVDVDARAVYLEPRAAVEHAVAPAAYREDLTGPAEPSQVLGIELATVVQREIPVAVRPVRAGRPRSAERDREYSRERPECVGDPPRESQISDADVITHAHTGQDRAANDHQRGGARSWTRSTSG
jgi:hypothetical protein